MKVRMKANVKILLVFLVFNILFLFNCISPNKDEKDISTDTGFFRATLILIIIASKEPTSMN